MITEIQTELLTIDTSEVGAIELSNQDLDCVALLQKHFSDKRIVVVHITLSDNSKDFFDKLGLRDTIPLVDSVYLSFTNHTHCLYPSQCPSCCV